MKNLYETSTLTRKSYGILIDTSSLMSSGFERFAHNAEAAFLAAGKRIVVPPVVGLEIYRHVGSGDSEKADLAMQALHVLRLHPDLFEAPWGLFDDTAAARAFADPKLLSALTDHLCDGTQLLITNDKRLGSDACNLNSLSCCQGKRVTACYINDAGELCSFDGADNDLPNGDLGEALTTDNYVEAEKTQAGPEHVGDGQVEFQAAIPHPDPDPHGNDGVVAVCGVSVGIVIGAALVKYRSQILRGFRKILNLF